MVDSENFMMLFIGLEIGSISLYALAGINKGSLLSNEASLKYFLLGSLASCVLVYGISLMYVSLSITGVYETTIAISFIGADNVPLTTLIGMLLLIIGLLFKMEIILPTQIKENRSNQSYSHAHCRIYAYG